MFWFDDVVTEQRTRHVHLFDGDRLVGTVQTVDNKPGDSYVVDGVGYRCISYMEITEKTGDRGFDVEVARLPANPNPNPNAQPAVAPTPSFVIAAQ